MRNVPDSFPVIFRFVVLIIGLLVLFFSILFSFFSSHIQLPGIFSKELSGRSLYADSGDGIHVFGAEKE